MAVPAVSPSKVIAALEDFFGPFGPVGTYTIKTDNSVTLTCLDEATANRVEAELEEAYYLDEYIMSLIGDQIDLDNARTGNTIVIPQLYEIG